MEAQIDAETSFGGRGHLYSRHLECERATFVCRVESCAARSGSLRSLSLSSRALSLFLSLHTDKSKPKNTQPVSLSPLPTHRQQRSLAYRVDPGVDGINNLRRREMKESCTHRHASFRRALQPPPTFGCRAEDNVSFVLASEELRLTRRRVEMTQQAGESGGAPNRFSFRLDVDSGRR